MNILDSYRRRDNYLLVLDLLANAKDRISPQDIAEKNLLEKGIVRFKRITQATGFSEGKLNHYISNLELHGLVTKKLSLRGYRTKYGSHMVSNLTEVSLTEAGKTLVQELYEKEIIYESR